MLANAWTEGAAVMVEGAFSDGSAAKDAIVTVYNQETGEVMLEGKTDEAGMFSFPVTQKVEMKVEVNAGMGHVASSIIPVEDITSLAGDTDASAAGSVKMPQEQLTAAPGLQISKQEMQRIIDKSLKKQLRPVFEQIEARKVTDILAGVGYIIGLVGLAAYVNYRKRNGRQE